MTIRIDSLTTEVTTESAPPARGAEPPGEATGWREQERLAAARLRLLRDELRTHARGNDD